MFSSIDNGPDDGPKDEAGRSSRSVRKFTDSAGTSVWQRTHRESIQIVYGGVSLLGQKFQCMGRGYEPANETMSRRGTSDVVHSHKQP
jgi:hypothetical protein